MIGRRIFKCIKNQQFYYACPVESHGILRSHKVVKNAWLQRPEPGWGDEKYHSAGTYFFVLWVQQN